MVLTKGWAFQPSTPCRAVRALDGLLAHRAMSGPRESCTAVERVATRKKSCKLEGTLISHRKHLNWCFSRYA